MMLIEIPRLVKSHSLEQLRSVPIVEGIIKQCGLHNDDRITSHYGVEDKYFVDGGMLQQPRQLAEAMVYLSDKNIKKYVEIGTFNGTGTVFMASYLSMFNPLETITVDNLRSINPHDLLRLENEGIKIKQILGTSDNIKGEKSDLCFIDGDHHYDWVVRDYENVGKPARIVMFHDIIDDWVVDQMDQEGSIRQWNELKHNNPDKKFTEFTYHPEGKRYFGIGIMEDQ